jgi:two-component system, chemotaxis family, sensor kinase CheA
MNLAIEKEAEGTGQGGGLLRVSAEKVSRLMDLVGELSLSVSEVVRSPDLSGAGIDLTEFEKSAHRLTMVVREVQDAAAELRLVPVGEVFRRLRRMVRELERQTGKKIDLILEGEETAIDKVVSDRLYEPLVHVVRNSADHGLESPEEREAAGKSETGRIVLAAAQVGSEIQITVKDDGRGLDRERILARARERGLVGAGVEPDDAALWQLILEPGFSTAEQVTALSGRGVGMDVLNSTMKDLRGHITIDSQYGRGCQVLLSIPVTLAFLDCLVMRLGRRLFATPVDVVADIFQPSGDQIIEIPDGDGGEMVRVRESYVPICRLPQFYGEDCTELTPLDHSIVIVFNTSSGPVGLPVDEMLNQQQVVMKPLTGQLENIRASWGCALLGTGEVALVLDCERLAKKRAF